MDASQNPRMKAILQGKRILKLMRQHSSFYILFPRELYSPEFDEYVMEVLQYDKRNRTIVFKIVGVANAGGKHDEDNQGS